MTDDDIRRLSEGGATAEEIVQWVGKDGIALEDSRWFVQLRPGRRVMVLKHRRHACIYLGKDNNCRVYAARPLGCRIFPFDPEFTSSGKLKRLQLIQATECPFELNGHNELEELRALHQQYEAANDHYLQLVAEWNQLQRARQRAGRRAQSGTAFLAFLGFARQSAAQQQATTARRPQSRP